MCRCIITVGIFKKLIKAAKKSPERKLQIERAMITAKFANAAVRSAKKTELKQNEKYCYWQFICIATDWLTN
jgi:hypothetical protein